MITVDALTKSYGTHVLFHNVSFSIGSWDRVGLVGRNGSGKTTLFRLLLGEEEADSGIISVPKGSTIGHLAQTIDFRAPTVLEEGCRYLRHNDDGSDESYRVKAILHGLGFSRQDFMCQPSRLSSGFQVRLSLARLLASEPDLLLLDEPTNYLDILSIRWLEGFLRNWKRSFVIITHDRQFMDSVATHTMGIYRQGIRKVAGPTEKLYHQILEEEEVYEKTRINEERRRRELEQFINRFRAQATRAKAVQSKIKALARRGHAAKKTSDRTLEFEFPAIPFHGKWVLEARGLSFGYDGGLPLIEDLSVAIGRRDRIGVIGKNGKGKSTLLNLLTGELRSQWGEITVHENVVMGYFGQASIERLNGDNTVEEEIGSVVPASRRKETRTICGIMLFDGDKALKRIGVLSGGEKSRVLLGKLIATPSNLLVLDEPTNHLDMESVDSLVEALDAFPGAVIIATHSEMILNAIAERLIVFDETGLSVFEGTYGDFLQRVGWKDEEGSQTGLTAKEHDASNRKGLKRLKAELINERSRTLKPLKEQVDAAEQNIMELEQRIKREHEELQRASEIGDGRKIVALSISIHDGRLLVDKLFDELEHLSVRYDGAARVFEQRLKGLEEDENG
jgi:ATP-binding cassette, subfamily F, member 3